MAVRLPRPFPFAESISRRSAPGLARAFFARVSQVVNLPGQVWKLPKGEDDEAAEEGTGRILALSDGVFAIALTLLVFGIAVPAAKGDAALPHELLRLWSRYLAYALSFLVIGRFWVSHHVGFRLVARYDSTLVWLNLVLLLFVAFLPFPTAVLGLHIGSPAAAVLYAASMVLLSGASAGCWWYASRPGRLLRPEVSRNKIRGVRARTLSAPLLFAATVPIALVAPYVAEILWFCTFPVGRMAYVWFSAGRRGGLPPSPDGP